MTNERHSHRRRWRLLGDRGKDGCTCGCFNPLESAQSSPISVSGTGSSSASTVGSASATCAERRAPDRALLGVLALLRDFSLKVTSIRRLSNSCLPVMSPAPGCWLWALFRCLSICLSTCRTVDVRAPITVWCFSGAAVPPILRAIQSQAQVRRQNARARWRGRARSAPGCRRRGRLQD